MLTAEHRNKISRSLQGHVITELTKKRISESLKNEKHFNWKEKPTYGIVHYWLRQNYGRPQNCFFCKRNTTCEWALIKGKNYERNRDNFMPLCRKCHSNYDYKGKKRVLPECLDCGVRLRTIYSKRCQPHAQQKRFRKEPGE